MVALCAKSLLPLSTSPPVPPIMAAAAEPNPLKHDKTKLDALRRASLRCARCTEYSRLLDEEEEEGEETGAGEGESLTMKRGGGGLTDGEDDKKEIALVSLFSLTTADATDVQRDHVRGREEGSRGRSDEEVHHL